MRFETAGLCLHRLRAADLAAVDGDGAVQRHILWFEWRDFNTAPREHAT
jgi:hypothetical protein